MGYRRNGVRLVAVAVCVMVVAACGTAKRVAEPRAIPVSQTLHRVVLAPTWTRAVLTRITRRLIPHGKAWVTWQSHPRYGAAKGWQLVVRDPTRSRSSKFDAWAKEVIGQLYIDRRKPSAPKLAGTDGPVRVYAQGRPVTLRAEMSGAAPRVGLELRSLWTPALGGMMAPVVTFAVSDTAKFRRWFDPGCIYNWVLPWVNDRPAIGSGPSPSFAVFFSITDSKGRWLERMSSVGGATETWTSRRGQRLIPARYRDAGSEGISPCPAGPPST